jgi:hypothetical protein
LLFWIKISWFFRNFSLTWWALFKLSRQEWQQKSDPTKLISWNFEIFEFFAKFYPITKTTNLGIRQILELLFHCQIQVVSLINFHKLQTKSTQLVKIHFDKKTIICKQTRGKLLLKHCKQCHRIHLDWG